MPERHTRPTSCSSASLMAHIDEGTKFDCRFYPAEKYAVISVGSWPIQLDIFPESPACVSLLIEQLLVLHERMLEHESATRERENANA
jgi:hypothetical protein